MYAIISELNKPASEEVKSIWQQLALECELDAIFHLPTPHLTWLICEDLDIPDAVPVLSGFVSQETCFSTHTTGLGVFTGKTPVLYLPVVKTKMFLSIHQIVWNLLTPFVRLHDENYSPEAWVPHVTLALNDLTMANLHCAINHLGFKEIRIEIFIASLSIVEFENDIAGEIINCFPFQKPELKQGENYK